MRQASRALSAFVPLFGIAVAISGTFVGGCDKRAKEPTSTEKPALRLYVLGSAAGAIEPCGCVKDMLGGVDHLGALLAGGKKTAVNSVLVGAGSMFFADPRIEADRHKQSLMKAEAMGRSLGDVGLAAWAPGANDWSMGSQELQRLAKLSGAKLLAGNLSDKQAELGETLEISVGGRKLGLAGVSIPKTREGLPEGVALADAKAALEAAQQKLAKSGVSLRVGLITAQRGEALRIAESVSGFQVLVIGKPFDEGEANDPMLPPTVIGDSLVVQAPNHLQAVAVVDLFVEGDDLSFAGASDVRRVERLERLQGRIEELERRIAQWQGAGKTSDLARRKRDLAKLKEELKALQRRPEPPQGSYFRYELVRVREGLGTDAKVKARLSAYYRSVNDHNREAFKDRKPPPAEEGQSSYLGAQKCSSCHLEEQAFWAKSRHANAYQTLVKDHKQFNLECVSCHVTGYEKPGGSSVTHVEGLTAVQCEVCHGPGSQHAENPADLSLIQKSPDKRFCADSCHHPPHVHEGWDVEAAWLKIIGPGHGAP